MPKGWNKGAAALYLRDYLGVAPEDVFVFGDAENDLTMREAVENSVAVSNFTPRQRPPPKTNAHISSMRGPPSRDAIDALSRGEFPFER